MDFRFKPRTLYRLVLLLVAFMGMQQTYAQNKPKKSNAPAQPRKSEVYLVPTMDGYDTCFTVADAGKKWFFYNRRSERSSEDQNEYRSAKKNSSGSIEVSYVTKSINRAGPGGAAHPETVEREGTIDDYFPLLHQYVIVLFTGSHPIGHQSN